MQKIRAKVMVYLISLPVAVSCILRFFLLLNHTDKKTGLLTDGNNLSLIIYALAFLIIVLAALYSYKKTHLGTLFDLDKGERGEYLSASFLAAAFFADFIYQGYNCYDYFSRVSYIDYAYFIPLALSGLLSLVCCFYFICVGLTANGSNYDFRNFRILHFMPVLWGFVKLLLIMFKIIDIRLDVESTLEFLMIAVMIMFFFCYISMLDNKGRASRLFVFFAVVSFSLSLILALPRLVIIAIGKYDVLSHIDYFSLSYIAAGVFAVTLTAKADKVY